MKIKREISEQIISRLQNSNKIIIIYGARQTGKTTLARDIISELRLKSLELSGDEIKHREVLSSQDSESIAKLIFGYDFLFIDEAQRIPNIGLNLKIIHDKFPNLKILVTGSSSFDLANTISEPLTGRHWSYELFPISAKELLQFNNEFEIQNKLSALLIYGSYPEIFNLPEEDENTKRKYLSQISSDYLYKDSLELLDVKNSAKVRELLKLLALQVGSNVSMNELSNKLGIARSSVERYIDLLEKNFVIFRLTGFGRNLRKEVTASPKIYFYDLGIRNALIDDFRDLTLRNDVGGLWENFLIIERIKFMKYSEKSFTPYFWRVYTGAEVDYVEESDGALSGYEFKFKQSYGRKPESWLSEYENATWKLINQDNWLEFVR